MKLQSSDINMLDIDEKINIFKKNDFINETQEFLNNLNNDYKYYTPMYNLTSQDTRKIITSYMIFYHKDEVLNVKDELSEKIYDLAGKVVINIDKIQKENNINIFTQYFTDLVNYLKIFDYWKKREATVMARPLIVNYYLYKDSIEFYPNKKEEIEQVMKYIRKNITILLGKDETEKILTNRKVPIDLNEPMIKQVKTTMHKAFWDLFKERVEKFEYEPVLVLLTEIRECLLEINDTIEDKLNTFLDLELLKNMLDNAEKQVERIDKNYITSIGINVINMIIQSTDEKSIQKLDEVKKDIVDKIKKLNEIDYLVYVFQRIYSLLECIRIIK